MKKRLLIILLVLCNANIALAKVDVEAIDSSAYSKTNMDLDDVVVLSSKQRSSMKLSPLSYSITGGKEIERKQISNLRDFASLIPNFYMPDYGSKLTSPVYLRGIGSKINSPSIGLNVDNIPYFSKSTFNFDMIDVARVEVLRGPQGTLYGRNTMGGVINVYTKRPLDYKGGSVKLSAGNYNNNNVSASYYGVVDDNFGYSISLGYKSIDGFEHNAYNDELLGGEKNFFGRIRLRWLFNDNLDINFVSSFENNDQDGYPYLLYNNETKEKGIASQNDESTYNRRLMNHGLNIDYNAEKFRVTSSSSIQYFDDDQALDQDFTSADLYFVQQRQNEFTLSQDIQFSALEGKKYDWLVGAFAFYNGSDRRVDMSFKQGLVDAKRVPELQKTIKNYDNPTYGGAIYGQIIFNDILVEGLSATLGARYDYENINMKYSNDIEKASGTTPAGKFDEKMEFGQFSPKASIQYDFNQTSLVYALFSKGYKTGGFNTSFDNDWEKNYDPEYSYNYEIGGRCSLWNNRINLDASVFYIDWRNQQVYHMLASGYGPYLTNAGKTRSYGAEFSMSINPINNLNAQLAYGYTNAKFKSYEYDSKVRLKDGSMKDVKIDYSGNRLPLVPEHTLTLSADYTIPLIHSWLDDIIVSAQYKLNGNIYWNDKNSASQDIYGILNAKISFEKDDFQFDIWANNITNEDYIAYYLECLGKGFIQQGKPVMFGANILFHF